MENGENIEQPTAIEALSQFPIRTINPSLELLWQFGSLSVSLQFQLQFHSYFSTILHTRIVIRNQQQQQ